MIILSKEQILLLHERLVKATGGSIGIRDEGMLDSALSNPLMEKNYIRVFWQKQPGCALVW